MQQYQLQYEQTLGQPVERGKLSPSGRRAAREILLLCTTANISAKGKERLSWVLTEAVDWGYLLGLAEFHGVTPLIARNLDTNGFSTQIPQPYLDQLKHGYNSTLYRNVILSAELANVLSAFSHHGIAVIPLKGTILAEILYGNPALRTVVDMDILVHPVDVSLAGSLLVELGYKQLMPQQIWDHPFHEVPYCKQASFPLFIELHWDLDDRKLVAIPEQEIWHRAQPLQLQGISTKVLSPEDNLLFLANHLVKQEMHFLKSLGDISELLKKYDAVLDWDYIVESAHSWQIEAAVYYSLRQAADLLEAPMPISYLEVLKPALWRKWVLDFLMSREAFVSPIRSEKLRSETLAVAHSLMMKHVHQMLAVLSRHRGPEKKGAWLRTAMWIMLVFIAGVGRNGARIFSQGQWKALHARNQQSGED